MHKYHVYKQDKEATLVNIFAISLINNLSLQLNKDTKKPPND